MKKKEEEGSPVMGKRIKVGDHRTTPYEL